MTCSVTARLRLCVILSVFLACGCGKQGARGLSLDEPKAREACTAFLNAWKEGKPVESLKPDIIGRDYAWDAGEKLTAFEFLPNEKSDGANLHIPVQLTLVNAKGKESKSKVIYVVGTSPVVTVIRE